MNNRFLRGASIGTHCVSVNASGTHGIISSEITLKYWPKSSNDTIGGQIEIFTNRGQSFVIQGKDVDAFLDLMGLLNQVQKEQFTIDWLRQL